MLKPKFFTAKADRWFFLLPFGLSLFGLWMILDASAVAALRDFGDRFYYLKHQAVWLSLGLFLFLFFARLDYRILKKFALPGLILSLVLLVIVLIPGLGREVYGGRRWLAVGSFGFQPAEVAKLALVVYLATLFEKRKSFGHFLFIGGIFGTLLLLEPDFGTAFITFTIAQSLYFAAGTRLRNLVFISGGFLLAGLFLIFSSSYRKQRVLTFLNSSFDTQGASYHVRQILIALGSGGFFGRGLGQSRQKFLFLPEVTTDSIFAVIAEELGFLGAGILILAFILLVIRGLKLVLIQNDFFAQMLTVGIVSMIGIQAVVNLGAMVGLIPLTGIPLPFISYGGSSLLVCLSGMGIVYNISRIRY